MEIPGYNIQKEIGRGGMATVYLAIQSSLDRPVVLKVLNNVTAEKAEGLAERFIGEGRILASLNHPNIITIYDIGISNNLFYISMEYVHGGDLKTRLELPFSVDETLDLMLKIGCALNEAHKHGIVHRDVKPANILFRDEHTPLLTDFGIAKQVDMDSDLTSTGIFLGSPNYVSPEQADGVDIDGRADIYSLGCIFYEMLTGKKPYIANSVVDIVIQHKQSPIPLLPPELKEFQPLLNRMMAKKLNERMPDAETLINELNHLIKKRKKRSILTDFDITGASSLPPAQRREVRAKQILGGLLLMGLILFSSMKYVEVRLKAPAINSEAASTNTVLTQGPISIPAPDEDLQSAKNSVKKDAAQPVDTGSKDTVSQTQPPPQQVIEALLWLGKQSLEEFKLTYPAKDNAYYYYSRLLELDPGNKAAINGILRIAERYAILAEQSVAKNEWQKATAYVDIGLRIDPNNRSLLALKELLEKQDSSILGAFKSLFSGNK